MLVDINFVPFTDEHRALFRKHMEEHNAKYPDEILDTELHYPDRMGKGIYYAHNFSSRQVIEKIVEDEPAHRKPRALQGDMSKYMDGNRIYRREMNKLYSQKYKRGPFKDLYASYGLCDSPDQLLAYFPHLDDDDVPRIITMNAIQRKHQSSQGGFRYHKSGTYIGRQKPQHEYLYDDKHIDIIWGFHLWRVEDVVSG